MLEPAQFRTRKVVGKIRLVSPFAPALYTSISPKLTLLAEQQFATRWGTP